MSSNKLVDFRSMNPAKESAFPNVHAIMLRQEGMHMLVRSADLYMEEASRYIGPGSAKLSELCFKEAAKLYEAGHTPLAAFVVYLELGEFGDAKRIARITADEVGPLSQLGQLLIKFSELNPGSRSGRKTIEDINKHFSLKYFQGYLRNCIDGKQGT